MLTFVITISGNVIKQSPVTSPLQPMCCQVPKEDCNQVQKTTYEYVTKQQMSPTLSVLIFRKKLARSLKNLFRIKFKEENAL